jgi:hypothetical protein
MNALIRPQIGSAAELDALLQLFSTKLSKGN